MPKYYDVERERKNGAHFIRYDITELHPDITDEFSIEYSWCKYWVSGLNGGPSRKDVYKKNVANHDRYKYDGNSVVHRVEAALKDLPFMKNAPNAQKTIDQFKDCICMNNKTINMHAANAFVDEAALIKACKSCKNQADLSKVLRSLTAQTNAAKMNAAISQIYDLANRIGKNAIPNNADKNLENTITKLYNRCMFGDPKTKTPPLEIPNDPNAAFAAPDILYRLCEKVKEKRNLTPQQVYKELIAPCETTINRMINTQQKTK